MPINIPCEYECDQCGTKVDGLSGKLPDGWTLGLSIETLMTIKAKAPTIDVEGVQGVFHNQACYDDFVEALVAALPDPQAVSVEAVTLPLS